MERHILQTVLNHKAIVILLPALIGLGGLLLSVYYFEQYGWSLFICLPFIISFLSSFCWCFKREKSYGGAYGMTCLSILTLAFFITILAIDGFACLLMALPLVLLLALIGVFFGRWVGSNLGSGKGTHIASLLICCFPCLVSFEHAIKPEPEVHQVTSYVVIDAPIERVWDIVIAFPDMDSSPSGIFHLGISQPLKARIEGEGVGAIRYCSFSTGDFVEPITSWKKPHHLAFDVVENPPVMQVPEDVAIAHIDGYLESKRGEFRLYEKDGKVILQGTTWYSHTIYPRFYWKMFSDKIIQEIHLKVLNHIKKHAEEGNIN